MDAAHDYSAAMKWLAAPLSAYVSYDEHARLKVGPLDKVIDSAIVVRTSDGKILKGTSSSIQIGTNSSLHGDLITHRLFNAACYSPVRASIETYNGERAEAIALHSTCTDDKEHESDDAFSTLYVDPNTQRPLGVAGGSHEEQVDVTIEERFVAADGHIVPSRIDVNVAGKGWMSWLQVLTHLECSHYRFLDSAP